MKTRDEKMYQRLLIVVLLMISITLFAIVAKTIKRRIVYASFQDSMIAEENEFSEFDENLSVNLLDESVERKEYEIEQLELEYMTSYEEDETLPKGMIHVKQEGRNGIREIMIERTYQGDDLISEEIISDKIIKATINKVVRTGTAKYKSNYKIIVGDVLYVTPYVLALRIEPSIDSDKIYTLSEGNSVELIDILKEWYQVKYGTYLGYVPANCLTYYKPNTGGGDAGDEEALSKSQLLDKLSFSMKLNEPSGFTLEQFKKVLSNLERDTNKVFEQNAEYFYYAEKQYHINGIFMAALAIHESAYGTSTIAINKRNLFGYGASDSNPYGNAYSYASYAEGIDLVARVLVKYYLNPAGTSIFDGQVATGDFYYGSTVSHVNTKYATDKNWANSVYNYMKILYERL